MKHAKRLLALLLAAVMLFGMAAFSGAAQGKTYLVLGDSIGYGAGISNPQEANYGRIVADTNGFIYYNNAVNGHRSVDLLRLLTSSGEVIGNVQKADIISISIGGNDFLRGNLAGVIRDVQNGDLSSAQAVIAALKENFNAIIERIRALNPNAVILMQTQYNPLEGKPLGDVYDVAIGMINDMVLDEQDGRYEIVDNFSAFRGKEGLIAFDNIHPNAAGNIVIAQTVQARLYALGLADTAEITVRVQPQDHIAGSGSFFSRVLELFQRIVDFFRKLFGVG